MTEPPVPLNCQGMMSHPTGLVQASAGMVAQQGRMSFRGRVVLFGTNTETIVVTICLYSTVMVSTISISGGKMCFWNETL
jgi:hypothetical protein